MPNTYTQIHLQIVFSVKFRQALLNKKWTNELHAYITGIVQNNNHKMLCINTMPDHLHMLIGFRTHQSLGDLMEMVKGDSSGWINSKTLTSHQFNWQGGYGAFSYHKELVPTIIKYIQNQEEHHKTKTFREEYLELLKEFGVEYDERYIFRDLE